MNAQDTIVSQLVSPPVVRPHAKLSDWLETWCTAQTTQGDRGPFAAAVAASLQADRLAWAFFSGYQGAIQSAFGTAPGTVSALCVNETGRKITEIDTTLKIAGGALALSGTKNWSLAGIDGLELFVLARVSDGPPKGPGSLTIVRVLSNAPGILRELPRQLGIVPELPHCAMRFESVSIDPSQRLPWDGYADYVKPFRMREDVFVTGCVLACLVAEAHASAWPTSWSQRAVAVVSMLDTCSQLDPTDAVSGIAVAGALSFASDVLREADQHWTTHQQTTRDRWRRDLPLLALGKEARRQRAIQSWNHFGRESL
jgi:acyl-CoA dehydrogenase